MATTKKATVKKTTTAAETAELQELMAADAAAQTAPADMLAQITSAAATLQETLARIAELEVQAADLAKEKRRLQEEVLPALMDEAGVPKLTLEGGDTLERAEEVYASIAAANLAKASAWLVKHGYADILKSQFIIPVDKGDVAFADRIRRSLEKAKIAYTEKSAIHPSTLTAFVKESLKEGRKLPPSITHHVQPLVKLRKGRSR